jgi:hypothetical protein
MLATVDSEDGAGERVSELVRVADEEARPVPLPPVEGCFASGIGHLTSLPDGRLGYDLPCDDFTSVAPENSIRALDLASGADEELARVFFRPMQFAFAPDLSRGMVSRSSRLCAVVAWLIDGRAQPADIEVATDDRAFNLSDEPLEGSERCTAFARADSPAWSPDGESIAFLASPASIGLDGPARLDAPWNLYLMDAEHAAPRIVLDGIDSAYQLRWSPDGQWLAFSADAYDGQPGTFAYALSSGEVRRVASDIMFALAWSPNSQQIAGLIDAPAVDDLIRSIVVASLSPPVDE